MLQQLAVAEKKIGLVPETVELFHGISISFFPFLMRIQLFSSYQEIRIPVLKKTSMLFLVMLIIVKQEGIV